MGRILNFIGNMRIVKKIKLEISFMKSLRKLERRKFKPVSVDGSEVNNIGIIIKHDHDYVRGNRELLCTTRFIRKNKNEKYTVVYVDDDYYKLTDVARKFVIEQEISKVSRVVEAKGGYFYATNRDLKNFKSTNLTDRDVVREFGFVRFEEAMMEIAQLIGTSNMIEQCNDRCRYISNYISDTMYKSNRPVLRGRDIVAALYDSYGEGMYNILPKQALIALNKIVF